MCLSYYFFPFIVQESADDIGNFNRAAHLVCFLIFFLVLGGEDANGNGAAHETPHPAGTGGQAAHRVHLGKHRYFFFHENFNHEQRTTGQPPVCLNKKLIS